ncbi:hypothetical protein [Rubritalea marina]|uniref:hypothetical protein n=1 Tax=Rubritalea marina TaxID=361055 RepID=UPI0012EAA861|nr:hypothetical protein [Rubritalea marina]
MMGKFDQIALVLMFVPFAQSAEISKHVVEEQQKVVKSSTVKLRPKVPIHMRMDFLSDRNLLLMVPKGALIVVPKEFESKIVRGGKADGSMVSMKHFLASNSSWVETYEVHFEQMMGKRKILQEELERLVLLNKVIIAINGGRPAGVKPVALEPEIELFSQNQKGETP